MTKTYEIVELPNGDVALQREGENDAQTLVTIRFSTELVRFLEGDKFSIAKVMMEAGLERVAEVANHYAAITSDGAKQVELGIDSTSEENEQQTSLSDAKESLGTSTEPEVTPQKGADQAQIKGLKRSNSLESDNDNSESGTDMNSLAMESHLVH
ncbi:hypothetical protein [Aurantivibrio plasticivorans]